MKFLDDTLNLPLSQWPFINHIFVMWVQCPTENGHDALGMVLMGGEL